jgi:hypothetical protein
VSELQIEEDDSFQRREWRMERIGWVCLALFVIAAVAGVFGDGPLSSTRASDASGTLTVSYDRFVRASAVTELVIRSPQVIATDEIALWIEHSYLRDVEVASILPEPVRVEQRGGQIFFVFSAARATAPGEYVFRLKPLRAGRLVGTIGITESGVEVRQFAYF